MKFFLPALPGSGATLPDSAHDAGRVQHDDGCTRRVVDNCTADRHGRDRTRRGSHRRASRCATEARPRAVEPDRVAGQPDQARSSPLGDDRSTLLWSVRSGGSFSTRRTAPVHDLTIEVTGVGESALPVSAATAEHLRPTGNWRCTTQGTQPPLEGRPSSRQPTGSPAPAHRPTRGRSCRPTPARATGYQPVTLQSVEKVQTFGHSGQQKGPPR
jgi:hypothetical protein